MIVDPEGYIVAENKTDSDELIIADIDLDACQYVIPLSLLLAYSPCHRQGKNRTFAFAKHRRPEHYGAIVERAGVVEPPEVV